MKIIRFSSLLFSVVLITSCVLEEKTITNSPSISPSATETFQLGFSIPGFPYWWDIAPQLAKSLRGKILKPTESEFAAAVYAAGAINAAKIYYIPLDGSSERDLLTVFIFPEAAYELAQLENQPAPYGDLVKRENGLVFSVAGLQALFFESGSSDARNQFYLQERMFESEFWKSN